MNSELLEKAKQLIKIVGVGGTGSHLNEDYFEDAVDIIKQFIQDSEKSQEKLPIRYSKKEYSKDSHYYQLAEIVFNSANKLKNIYGRYLNNPEAVEIILQNNAHEFCKIVEKGKQPIQEVIDILDWALNDEFWKINILSAYKFREQYDKLRIQKCGLHDPDPEMTRKLIGVFRALSSNPSYKPHEGAQSKFIEAGRLIKEFFGNKEIDLDLGIEYLLKCLNKNYIEKSQVVYPGNLCSEFTWTVLMPQYLNEIGLD